MNEIVTFVLTPEQLSRIKIASSLPTIITPSIRPFDIQKRVNYEWAKLGKEMGFIFMTVKMDDTVENQFTAMEAY